jgi:hypothetical protein
MQYTFRVLLLAGAILGSAAGAANAQGTTHQAPTQVSPPLPGFTTEDPRPGTSGGSPASSGSNVGSNVGAGMSASPVGNDIAQPGGAPDVAQAPRTRPLFGLSRDLP